jgi:hypothetical protein
VSVEKGIEAEVGYMRWDPGNPTDGNGEDCIFVSPAAMYQNDDCSINFCFPCQFETQVHGFDKYLISL